MEVGDKWGPEREGGEGGADPRAEWPLETTLVSPWQSEE